MSAPTAAARRPRPIQGFAKAVGACAPQAKAYGQCIFKDYNNVHKDMCLQEFLKLRECVNAKLRRKT